MSAKNMDIMAIAATAVFCFLLINLPEMVWGNESSPYVFPDRGYYEQFGEAFEADNELRYQ